MELRDAVLAEHLLSHEAEPELKRLMDQHQRLETEIESLRPHPAPTACHHNQTPQYAVLEIQRNRGSRWRVGQISWDVLYKTFSGDC